MRTLKLQIQTTIDGYMGGPEGEMDWMDFNWSDDVGAYIDAMTSSVDCILLGRELAGGFIPTWAAEPQGESKETVAWMNDTPKVVVSNTLTESPWPNATILGGDLASAIRDLKERPGGDIITYGGAKLASGLIAEGLIDEIHLFVNPVSIGSGLPVFPDVAGHQRFRLAGARPFECGITALHYAPKRD
ncbi:dihydrofolate reductase family protein [Nonomuraea sp. NPDC049504]|uniref:dihydrofolate reductase family protein n=1 Tax=Nonomuraea sp. NPDC049504 TaxID=3154729 RepID=UPI00341EE85E